MIPPKNEIELIGILFDAAIANGGFKNRQETNAATAAVEKTAAYIKHLEKQVEELTPKTDKK